MEAKRLKTDDVDAENKEVLDSLTFAVTKTRVFGVVIKEVREDLPISHPSRVEKLDDVGMLVSLELSKKGTPVAPAAKPLVRRIGASAFHSAGWAIDSAAEAELGGDLTALLAALEGSINESDNDSYKKAFAFMKTAAGTDSATEWHVFSQVFSES